MKVLIPVDGSTCCQKTMDWASLFLDKQTLEIYLLNVIEVAPVIPVIDLDTNKADHVLKAARTDWEARGFKVARSEYIVDAPSSAICNYADEMGIDLIVLGSHGYQGLAKFLMGSVSEAVFKNAKQPVLVVKNHENLVLPSLVSKEVNLSHTLF